jgi:hypothetical protein
MFTPLRRQSLGVNALAALAALTQLSLLTPTARADEALIVCSGTDTTTFSPGLRLFARQSTTAWTDDYPVCVSNELGTFSATSPGGGYTTQQSCLDLLTNDPSAGSQDVDWSTGGYSTFAWEATDVTIVNALGQQLITVIATIVDGLYVGQTLIEEIVTAAPNLTDCLFEPGLLSSTGSITLTVLPL